MMIYAKNKETGEVIASITGYTRSYGVLIMIAHRISDYFDITEEAALTLLETCSEENPIDLDDCVMWTTDKPVPPKLTE